jgi:hypothetical protein
MFRIIKIVFIFLLVTLAGIGGWGWFTLSPQWETLQEKDPERFQAMIASAKGLELVGMVQLFQEIKQLTQEEVYRLRYERWKAKMQGDDELSLADWNEEVLLREQTSSTKKEEWDQKITDIEHSHMEGQEKYFKEYWRKANPWEKGLLLREKCIKFFSLEKQASGRRLQARKFSSISVLTTSPLEEGISIPEICARLVPITHDAKGPDQALDALKNHMNYFYFNRLLNEIGIPPNEVFVFESKLNRMTQAFSTH